LQEQYSHDEVPDIDEIANLVGSIKLGNRDQDIQTKQARALFSLYYLTGCRLSEIVLCKELRVQKVRKKEHIDDKGIKSIRYEVDKDGKPIVDKDIIEHNYKGIRKKDFKIEEIDGRKCLFIRTENRKHKKRKTKRQPIPIEFESGIVYYLLDYLRMLDSDSFLFPFGPKRATQIINTTTGFNIHFIRHIRATHLVTIYDFNEQMLVQFMGWTDSRPAKSYIELRSRDTFRQFYKTKGG